MGKIVVFTDLDGTLLDAESYAFKGAEKALALLRESESPLVIASSKTRAEIEELRERLNNAHPFISENGGGVFTPKGYFSSSEVKSTGSANYEEMNFGVSYAELRQALIEIRRELSLEETVRGFGDMDVREVARLTGLSPEAARRAKAREFDEPFLCNADESTVKGVLNAIEARGLAWTRGRFFHILGADCDKADGVRYLRDKYEATFGSVTTIALGDALNDTAMLKEADIGILMARPDGSYEDIGGGAGNIIKAKGSGSLAWSEAVIKAIGKVKD